MKKTVLLILLVVLAVLPVAAKTTLLNVGYDVKSDFEGWDGVTLRSLSINSTFMKGETSGFYSQWNGYYGLSIKRPDSSTSSFSEYGEYLFGGNVLFGYGGDINFGSMGILIGAGMVLDLQYHSGYGGYWATGATGLGLGADFYFQPGEGTFLLDAGVNFGWTPWAYAMTSLGSGSYTNWGCGYINFHVGIGWRTGAKSSNSSSDSSSSSSDDGW